MILIDPELEPTGKPSVSPARLESLLARGRSSRTERLPSARALAVFLRLAQQAVRLHGEVTVLLTTDKAIRRLNRRFRKLDKATDVLSFPASGPAAGGLAAGGLAGDLAISVQTARRQAGAQGHTLSVEIKVLLLHGLLHLAGYDHENDDGRMARRERVLRARLGLPQGLIERADAEPGVDKSAGRRGMRSART